MAAKRKINLSNYTSSILYIYKTLKTNNKDYINIIKKSPQLIMRLIELYNTDRYKVISKMFNLSFAEYNKLSPDEIKRLEYKSLESNRLTALINEGNGGGIDMSELEKQ